jgi:hypothetical protein
VIELFDLFWDLLVKGTEKAFGIKFELISEDVGFY